MTDQNAKTDRHFIEQQRRRLEALRAQLLGQEVRSREDVQADEEEYEQARELGDKGQLITENEVRLGLHEVEERQLRAIDRALHKIDEGTYGFSDLSGEPIPKARLEAAPEAVLTVQEEEQMERRALSS